MEIGDCPDWYECRTKWQNLRVTFKTNLTKMHKVRTGQISVNSVRVYWRFFDAMQFVLKGKSQQSLLHCDDQTIITHISESPTPSLSDTVPALSIYETATAPAMCDTETTALSICDTVSASSICDTDTAPAKCDTDTVTSICDTTKVVKRYKRSKRSAVEKPSLAKRSLKSTVGQQLPILCRPDEFSAFGEYVASELRCLSYADAQRLKRRMARLLLDFHEECGAS